MSANGQSTFPFTSVAIVADPLNDVHATPQSHLRRDLEKTADYVLADIIGAIRMLGLAVHHYTTPAQLADAARSHKRDVVLSIYGGQKSRNRMALVPAVCESFGLRYVGPDVYGRVICQDKELSKRLASEAGLVTPPHLVLRRDDDLVALSSFQMPYVVKPLMEGSSIGIGPHSLVRSMNDGVRVAKELLKEFGAPVIAESFVSGIEVNFSIIQTGAQTEYRLTEAYIPESPDYFKDHLFDASQKLEKETEVQNRPVNLDILSRPDLAALLRLPLLIGGIGYGRVDGKLHEGRFHFLEITPDAWLAESSSFASGFLASGWTYARVISEVLLSQRE
jgi:D-alanine-D-alanine ligase